MIRSYSRTEKTYVVTGNRTVFFFFCNLEEPAIVPRGSPCLTTLTRTTIVLYVQETKGHFVGILYSRIAHIGMILKAF